MHRTYKFHMRFNSNIMSLKELWLLKAEGIIVILLKGNCVNYMESFFIRQLALL
jgi:hypothetical protein